MSDIVSVKVKSFDRESMLNTYKDLVLHDRELLIETEGSDDTFIARFKIGDGLTPYHKLEYVSSIYKLLPNVLFYNKDYTNGINIVFPDKEE